MPKIVYFIIACVVILTAVTVIGITGTNASADTKFVPVSVLAKDQANYGVDDHPFTIPPVSPEIIKDAAHDRGSNMVTTIPYKILPPKNTGTNNSTQSESSAEVHNSYGNDGSSASNQNQNNNQNPNSNQNDNKGKGKDKNKDNGKDKENNGGGNNSKDKANNGGGSDNGKVNEKSNGNDNGNGNGNGNNK